VLALGPRSQKKKKLIQEEGPIWGGKETESEKKKSNPSEGSIGQTGKEET